MNYSEDPTTIDLYPESAFEEDLTPDVLGDDIQDKCKAIHKACKGKLHYIYIYILQICSTGSKKNNKGF